MVLAPVTNGIPRWLLAVETSCDDTSVSVLRDGREATATVSQTQVAPHAAYGGIVPEVASRIHAEAIDGVCVTALEEADVGVGEIGAVAVTVGPGLPGSLLVGLEFARGLAFGLGVPLVPVNHLEGHIAAAWLDVYPGPALPAAALVVSGGHTELVMVEGPGRYRTLGRTRDDAAGEAFDKVARMLGLGFPGGPAIQEVAERAGGTPYNLPRAWLRGTNDFSFSGLKTAVRRLLEHRLGPDESANILRGGEVWDEPVDRESFVGQVALAFEESVVEVLVQKTVDAAAAVGARSIIVTGGVAANQRLRAEMREAASIPLFIPAPARCTDNAAMIGLAGAWALARGEGDRRRLEIQPGMRLV